MLLLHLGDIYERGLASFSSLSSLERDVFAVHDANLRFEMEGSLSTFVGSSISAPIATWLADTLSRAGDKDSLDTLHALLAACEQSEEHIAALSACYYSLAENRWSLLDRYLEDQGAAVAT